MGSVAITHPETGAEIVVPFEAYDTHYRQSGWMTHAELAEHRARIAEREQPPAKAAKTAKNEE